MTQGELHNQSFVQRIRKAVVLRKTILLCGDAKGQTKLLQAKADLEQQKALLAKLVEAEIPD